MVEVSYAIRFKQTKLPKDQRRMMNEAEALMSMCGILRKTVEADGKLVELTMDFVEYMKRVKDRTRLKDKPLDEAVSYNGFLTLAVLGYLKGRGYSLEFIKKNHVSMVAYLQGFFLNYFPEFMNIVEKLIIPEAQFWNQVFYVTHCVFCRTVRCTPLDLSPTIRDWWRGWTIHTVCCEKPVEELGVVIFCPEYPPINWRAAPWGEKVVYGYHLGNTMREVEWCQHDEK